MKITSLTCKYPAVRFALYVTVLTEQYLLRRQHFCSTISSDYVMDISVNIQRFNLTEWLIWNCQDLLEEHPLMTWKFVMLSRTTSSQTREISRGLQLMPLCVRQLVTLDVYRCFFWHVCNNNKDNSTKVHVYIQCLFLRRHPTPRKAWPYTPAWMAVYPLGCI